MRALKRGLVGLVAVAALAIATVWIGSEIVLRRTYDPVPTDFVASGSSEAIAHGERMARVLGCYDGCHGPGGQGAVFIDDPVIGRFVAPNLGHVAAAYSDTDLDHAIRQGIRPDGRSAMAMPSHFYRHMSDDDLDAIVSFLRSEPVSPNPDLPTTRPGPLARFGLLVGMFEPSAVMASDDSHQQAQLATQWGYASTGQERRGAYLVTIACGHCHGVAFQGEPQVDTGTPDLRMALAYDDSAFVALMRRGLAHDGRDIGLMGEMSEHFRHFTDDEIASIHAYLRARATAMAGGTGAADAS